MTKEELIGIMRDSDPQEWLVCRNVHVRLVEFETLPGAIYLSKKGNYYIIINDRLAFPERQKTLPHEIKHLLDHIEAPGLYILGDDFSAIEREAEEFAYEIFKKVEGLS